MPSTLAARTGTPNAATALGIPADAIYNWLNHGQVPARRANGRWCIPWDPQAQ
ncbi:hypothetical protein [Nonomuraea sp. NPDC049141]|uniref:hypothetical protein n=1 Tax=unclassified Nonomuraea TaxID=2593643 RepID=UPI0033C96DC0